MKKEEKNDKEDEREKKDERDAKEKDFQEGRLENRQVARDINAKKRNRRGKPA